jgi:hypothetical protein
MHHIQVVSTRESEGRHDWTENKHKTIGPTERPILKGEHFITTSKKTHRKPVTYVGFEVFTAVVMKSTIFWDITPCNPLRVNTTFRRNTSPPSSGFLSPTGSLVEPMGVGGFILSCGRANGNWVPLFHPRSVSYITRNSGWRITLLTTCFHAGFLLCLLFDPEDGGDMFLWNVG